MNRRSFTERQIKAALEQALPLYHERVCFEWNDGVVTLNGTVEDEQIKRLAETALSKIAGVTSVIDNLSVGETDVPDKLKREIIRQLKGKMEIPADRIRLCITPKTIEVRGTVKWNYQKKAALDIIDALKETRDVLDYLVVDNALNTMLKKEDILEAIRANGRITSEDINVIVNGSNIIIVGSVPDVAQQQLAQKIVQEIPGVGNVRNALLIH